jgi:hypothetical protein
MTTLPLQRYSSEGTTARMAEVATDMVNQIAFTPDQKGRSMNMGEGGWARRGCKWPGPSDVAAVAKRGIYDVRSTQASV